MLKSLLMIFVFTCIATLPGQAQDKNEPQLNGIWLLQSKSGGITGKKFAADKKHPVYKAFKNEHFYEGTSPKKMKDQGRYNIVSERSFFTGKPEDVILTKDGRTWIYDVSGNKLVLKENHPDGFNEIYRKTGRY